MEFKCNDLRKGHGCSSMLEATERQDGTYECYCSKCNWLSNNFLISEDEED